MKFGVTVFVLSLALPVLTFAACADSGVAVVVVNGILTNEKDAKNETHDLGDAFYRLTGRTDVQFINGYNAIHLNGGGDTLQSISQAFGGSVSDFDLNTILNQIHSEVTTRKIILVGHSQGTYYTNEMYKYLVANGVSRESIAVYNIATPASFVAGGGEYVTSANDKVINYIRSKEVNGNVGLNLNTLGVVGSVVNSALRPNIVIPKEPGYQGDEWGGHHFSTYLNGAASRIVSDISYEMKNLRIGNATSTSDGCFTPPAQGIKYKTEAAVFMVADPIDRAVTTAASSAANLVASGLGLLLSPLMAAPAPSTAPSQVLAAALTVSGSLPLPVAPNSPIPQKSTETEKKITGIVQPVSFVPPAAPVPASVTVAPTAPPTAPQPTVPNLPWPGYGGGGASNRTSSLSDSPADAISTATTSLAVDRPADNMLLATTTIAVSGSADAGAVVTIQTDAGIATTTADVSGAWAFSITLGEGAHTVLVQADSGGVISDPISRTITVDTLPPEAPTLSINDCDASLVSGLCVLPELSTRLTWQQPSGAAYYAVVKNDLREATTTSFGSMQTIADNATTTFTVVAYDAAGNAATSTSVDVVGLARSVVINEVSWAGDDVSPSNQWIELKNISPYVIDLSRITIERSGGDPITLSGSIGANNSSSHQDYAVIEPTSNPYTGSNPIISPFGPLSTSGEQISLTWNGSVLDATPSVSTCGGWCAGALNARLGSNVSGTPDFYSSLSMERAKDAPDGTLATSWHSTDSYGAWLGYGSPTWGTPGQQNSEGWPDAGVVCDASGTLVPNSAYHITSNSSCIILMKFITGNTFGPGRYAGMFRGDVGSSTGSMSSEGKRLAAEVPVGIADPQPGEHFFFVAIESRSWADDASLFNSFFTDGSVAAPHGNYLVVPFTYAP